MTDIYIHVPQAPPTGWHIHITAYVYMYVYLIGSAHWLTYVYLMAPQLPHRPCCLGHPPMALPDPLLMALPDPQTSYLWPSRIPYLRPSRTPYLWPSRTPYLWPSRIPYLWPSRIPYLWLSAGWTLCSRRCSPPTVLACPRGQWCGRGAGGGRNS